MNDTDPITRAAYEAYRALCRLEDALDRASWDHPDQPLDKSTRGALDLVESRWNHDTHRKIERARKPTRLELMGELLDEHEAEHGPIPQAVPDEVDAAWPERRDEQARGRDWLDEADQRAGPIPPELRDEIASHEWPEPPSDDLGIAERGDRAEK